MTFPSRFAQHFFHKAYKALLLLYISVNATHYKSWEVNAPNISYFSPSLTVRLTAATATAPELDLGHLFGCWLAAPTLLQPPPELTALGLIHTLPACQ